MDATMNNSKTKEEAAEKCREAGNAEFKRGDFAAAIKQYDKSIELNATVAAFANRAQAHLCLGSNDDAIRDAQFALNMDPAHLKARFRLGRAFFFKKMYENAMKHYEKCLALEPKNAQALQAIEQCKQEMASSTDSSESINSSTNTPMNTSTGSSSSVEPPEFRFAYVHIGTKGFVLSQANNYKVLERFNSLNGLRDALVKTRPVGPIAQIQLMDADLGTVYQFFKSLDPKMLEGGSLELQNIFGDENVFSQFMRLFKPKCIIIDGNARLPWDFDAYMRVLDPIRDTKLLSLSSFFCLMVDSKVPQQTVLDWLHSPLASPSHCSPAWSPPKPAAKASLQDVFYSYRTKQPKLNPCLNLANLWRHPAAKILNIGEDLLFNDQQNEWENVVNTLIDQCHKLFRLATRPLNYSVKVMRKVDVTKPPLLPRAFTNTLGEQLRVSVQRVEVDDSDIKSLQASLGPLPPNDLVIIERFHTS